MVLHAEENTRLFALLVGMDAAAIVMPWLHLLAWPWRPGMSSVARRLTCGSFSSA